MSKLNRKLLRLDTGETKPLIWPDPSSPAKKIELYVGEHRGIYDITSIGKQKIIRGPHGIYYHVRNMNKNFGREITIIESSSRKVSTLPTRRMLEEAKRNRIPEEFKVLHKAEVQEYMRDKEKDEIENQEKNGNGLAHEEEKKMESHNKDDIKIRCSLMGFGVSLIDNEPKEIIYISAHEIDTILEQKITKEIDTQDTNYFISLNIGHIQIDNMLDKSFPIIFGPQRLFITDSKKKTKDEDWEPFIQMQASITETKEKGMNLTRFNSLQLQLSEMHAFVDLEIVMDLLNVLNSIFETFRPESLSIKQIENAQKQIEYVKPQDVFKLMDPSPPKKPEIIASGGNKIFIEFLHLAAIKLRVSLRLKKMAVDPTGPLIVLEVLYSVVATLGNISDAPIYFTELIMKNVFSSPADLTRAFIKKYARQGVFQLYSLLGSIDLIGNPIGLLDRLCSGMFEFFNEPRKGLMKGPKEFAKGVGKGVRSLITNVVGGSLNSVSRVSGSLYSLVKYIFEEIINKIEMLAVKKSMKICLESLIIF